MAIPRMRTIALLAVGVVMLGQVHTVGAQSGKRPRFTLTHCFVARVKERAFTELAPVPQYLLLEAANDSSPPGLRGLAHVVHAEGATDYFWYKSPEKRVHLGTSGIDTADQLVLVRLGKILRGRGLHHGCCGYPAAPRAIEATTLPCASVPAVGQRALYRAPPL